MISSISTDTVNTVGRVDEHFFFELFEQRVFVLFELLFVEYSHIFGGRNNYLKKYWLFFLSRAGKRVLCWSSPRFLLPSV